MGSSGARRATGELSTALRRYDGAARRKHLVERLCREVAAFLQTSPDDIDPRSGFVQLGFDSLKAVDFRARLEQLLGTELRSTLLFDQPNCERLADFLLEELRPALDPAPRQAATRVDPEAQGLASAQPGSAIAIVGTACRMPGPAVDMTAFWRLLDEGGSAIGEPPEGRWPLDELYDPDPAVPGRIYTRRGGFLPQIERFDAAFFGIPPVEATMLDPQQRLLLEVAWEALEDASVPPERLQHLAPGVFVGMRASEYFQSQCARLPEDADAYYATGNAVSTAAGRLSYFLGFRGPCFALDTACSGSLVAVHQAVQSLRRGECRAALAGGVNTLVDPLSSVGLCRARMLAPDGLCKTFDARADGYVRAEGCGMLVMMRLEDARALGLPVRAIIRGTAINQDGRTGGLTVPHGPSQEAVVRSALVDAGLQADDIDYVEAHGTGTSLGDPIEVAALDAVFQGRRGNGRPLLVGSVKTNIGHLEAAAGISGLLKVVLALQHERLPAHQNLEQPNPHIPWDKTEIDVVTESRDWPRGERPRRAGVSSFGFSGTNAHVILEEGDPPMLQSPARQHQAVVLSAANETALREQAAQWAEAASLPDAPPLADIAYTAGHGRTHFAQRLGVVAGDSMQLANALRSYVDGAPTGVVTGVAAWTAPRIGFLFSGQGAQRPGAGRELYDEEPVFRAAIDRLARVFDRLRDAPLVEVLFGDDADRLRRTDYTQPAMFALQFALAELWSSVGIEPDVVLGHSIGEISAAAAAGVMSPEDGLRLCASRGALMVQHCLPGAMLAVFSGVDRILQVLGEPPRDISVAAVNGPAETVLSGARGALDAVRRRLEAEMVRTQPLAVSHAFHSPLMQPMLRPFERRLLQLQLQQPSARLVACRPQGDHVQVTEAEHWLRHVTEPVHFAAALAAAAREVDLLIEIGPSPVLLGLAARTLPRPLPGVPTLRAGQVERVQFLRGVVQCHVLGADVDFAALARADAPRRAALPTYPFQRQRFWLRHRAAPVRSAGHPLLGAPQRSLLLQPRQRLFEGTVAERQPAWLHDHRVYDRALLPAAAMLEYALAAAAATFDTRHLELRDVAITAPLWLSAQPVLTQVLLDGGREGARFQLCREDGGEWPTHATGQVSALPESGPTPATGEDAAGRGRPVDIERFYEDYLAAGLAYGTTFRTVRTLRQVDGAASGTVELPAELRGDAAAFVLHPVLLDGCFQIAGAATTQRLGEATYLPVGIERLSITGTVGPEIRCRARCRPIRSDRTRVVDLVLLDPTDRVTAVIDGLQLLRSDAHVLAGVDPTRWLHVLQWQRRPRPDAEVSPGRWVVTGPELHPAAAQIATQLAAAGMTVQQLGVDELATRLHRDGCDGLVFDASAGGPDGSDAIAAVVTALSRCVQLLGSCSPPPRLCVITADAVAADVLDRSPSTLGAAVWGFLRSVALEHPELRPVSIDRDHRTGMDLVARELLAGDDEQLVALRNEQRFTARLVPGRSGPGELALPPGPFRVRSLEYGRLERLAAQPLPIPEPAAGEVILEVAAAGLNFKDVLYALGMLREWSEAEGIHSPEAQPLGFECAGRVVAAAPDVRSPRVGALVLAAAGDALATHVRVSSARTVVLPRGIELAAAAGLPTIFATAIHGLEELARVRAGDKVLIHAAAGGVGLAALQICQRRGCQVFATSSPGKAAFLAQLGVHHWADSRGSDFDQVFRRSAPDGLDVVLNSLTGESISRSVGLLRQGGRFVEIGKRGIWTREQMAARRRDVQYFTFDLADEIRRDPALLPRLLGKLQEGLVDGSLRPVRTTVVPIERAPELFAAMAKGRHVGKLVLRLPQRPTIRPDRTYLITGGTGAVGRAVAAALIERGCRHLALLARNDVAGDWLAELAGGTGDDRRAEVRVFQADVADSTALSSALRQLRAVMPEVAGVVHAAGALDDHLLRDLDAAALRAVLRPKVDGTRNLAALLDERELDFFVGTSSMAAWLGNQAQAAYSAANAWLEAFLAARSARGRPGLAIAYGPWAEAGMAARLTDAQRTRLRELGIDSIPPPLGADLLLDLLGTARPAIGVLPVRWTAFLRQFVTDVPPLLHLVGASARGTPGAARTAAEEGGGAAALADELLGLDRAARAARLGQWLVHQLAEVLGHRSDAEIDRSRTFGELGVDSLLAVEIRTRLGRALGLPLPATLLFDHPDIERLTAQVLGLLPAPALDGARAIGTAARGDAAEAALDESDPDAVRRALEEQVRMMEERP